MVKLQVALCVRRGQVFFAQGMGGDHMFLKPVYSKLSPVITGPTSAMTFCEDCNLPIGHMASMRPSKQRCTWRGWRQQQRQQAQPHHLTLAMRTVLSAAGPLPAHLAMRPAALPQQARGATHQLLTVVRPTGTESGQQEGLKQLQMEAIAVTPRCHRAGEADVVEAEAELHVKLHVKREAGAVKMARTPAKARAMARRWNWRGLSWACVTRACQAEAPFCPFLILLRVHSLSCHRRRTAAVALSTCQHPSVREKLQGCCLQFRVWKPARAPRPPRPFYSTSAARRWRPATRRRRSPWAGVWVGEAAQPGPFTASDELLQQQARAAGALTRARASLPPFPLLPLPAELLTSTVCEPAARANRRRLSSPRELAEAETLSDTLSAHTPVASPPLAPRRAMGFGTALREGGLTHWLARYEKRRRWSRAASRACFTALRSVMHRRRARRRACLRQMLLLLPP